MQNCCKFTHKIIYVQLLNLKIRVLIILNALRLSALVFLLFLQRLLVLCKKSIIII